MGNINIEAISAKPPTSKRTCTAGTPTCSMIWFATAVAFVPVALEVPVCSIIPAWSSMWIAVIDLVKHLFKRG
jgi:hypothetical protein